MTRPVFCSLMPVRRYSASLPMKMGMPLGRAVMVMLVRMLDHVRMRRAAVGVRHPMAMRVRVPIGQGVGNHDPRSRKVLLMEE